MNTDQHEDDTRSGSATAGVTLRDAGPFGSPFPFASGYRITPRCTSCGKELPQRVLADAPHKCGSCMFSELAEKHAEMIREALEKWEEEASASAG